MIDYLPPMRLPKWLGILDAEQIENASIPLTNILKNSLFYPSSGFDGDPIKYLAGHFYSFIYADYGNTRDELDNALNNEGFRGYEIIGSRHVPEKRLASKGWEREPTRQNSKESSGIVEPFAVWIVFQQKEDAYHAGPYRFSLLYLCYDGVEVYKNLFINKNKAPKAIALIQPGGGFGGNWTDFTDRDSVLARSVFSNKAVSPEFLLFGGLGKRDDFKKPCWPEYNEHICYLEKSGGGTIGIWRKHD